MNRPFIMQLRAELISRKKNILILLCLYAMMPVLSILSSELEYSGSANEISPLCLIVFLIAQVFSVLLCTDLFRECHIPESADVTFSLPVSSGRRFAVKTVICALSTVLPYILAVNVIFIISRVHAAMFDYTPFAVFDWNNFVYIGFVVVVFTNAFSIMCSVFTSSAAGAASMSYVGASGITALPILVYIFLTSCAHIDKFNYSYDIMCCFGWGIISQFDTDMAADQFLRFYLLGAVNLLISLLMLFTAYKVYVRRERKSIFEFAPAKGFLLVMMSVIAAVTAFALAAGAGLVSVLVAFIAALAIYLLMLVKKGFSAKANIRWLAGLAAVEAAILVFAIASVKTEGFGISALPLETGGYYKAHITIYGEAQPVNKYITIGGGDRNIVLSDLEKVQDILTEYEQASGYEPRLGGFMINGASHIEDPPKGLTIVRFDIHRDWGGEEESGVITRRRFYINESDLEKLIGELKAV